MNGSSLLARLLAVAAWASLMTSGALANRTIPGSPPRVADPCQPDGACFPRSKTWGWYQTCWRPHPCDDLALGAGPEQPGAVLEEEAPGGPQLPEAGLEGVIGRPRPVPGSAGPAVGLPVEGAEPPAGDIPAPMIEPGPLGEPGVGGDPLDPFGFTPPAPAWMHGMTGQAGFVAAPNVGAPLPIVPQGGVGAGPTTQTPNLHGDDAPPALPASLQSALRSVGQPALWSQRAAATTLRQPASLRPAGAAGAAGGVVQTAAQTPLGIQLVNPAAGLSIAPEEQGLQQAIYFEASDAPAALPPIDAAR